MPSFPTQAYYPLAARTALVTGVDIAVPAGARSVVFEIDTTLDPASASITPTVQGKTPNGTYYTLLAGGAIADVGVRRLLVGPGMVAVANLAAQAVLPETIRMNMAVADTDSMTYSVSYKFSD